jgi:hypothetical protein
MLSNFKTWILGSGLLNEIINEYFQIALFEFEKGASFEEVEEMLSVYEQAELYLECEGIKLAIDYTKFFHLVTIVRLTNQNEINNIKIIKYERNERNEKDSIDD